jgi:hypothetical protein
MRELLVVRITMSLAFGAAGCSVFVDASDPQCETNAECVELRLGARCVDRVCVGRIPCRGSECDAGAAADAGDRGPGDCLRDAQCTDRAAPRCMRGACVSEALAERWLCPEDEPIDRSRTVRYSTQVVEFVTRMPPGNVSAKACRTQDPDCTTPIAEFKDETGAGLIELELPAGFTGFFEVKSDALTALSYLTKPLRDDLRDRDLQVSARTTVEGLSRIDMTEFDRSKGIALLEAFDCSGKPAGGVHFEESKGTSKPFYIIDQVPNSQATVSVFDEVNNVANGGFINLEPGFTKFTARWGVDGPLLGEFNAHVRADTFTFVDMYF